ncbi:MAG: PSD1 domain-containing protein [Planctomycetaceae bacterium]|nr:PSD1 domain-containing protein [Planctomycetaceae bacterium]
MRSTLCAIAAVSLFCLVACGLRADEPQRDALDFFENEIRPLLISRCVSCHGPKKSESSLRLDQLPLMMRGGDSGPAIVPGHPDESLIIQAVRHQDGYEMPPNGKLEDREIASLAKWVQQGAVWPDGMKLAGDGPNLRGGDITDEERAFWSFQPISDPEPPHWDGSPPAQSPVDQFILKRLSEEGLSLRPPADKRTLLRRATFDLTGLPPTPEELQAFEQDDSPEAFSRVIDRLLASSAYGERWGRHWLDVVRYADTAGETADYPAPLAYKYRNWVIDSVNADIPYDQFLREQLAGDILADQLIAQLNGEPDEATLARYREMKIATGFIAISRRFGFDSENYHNLTIQDTIDTVGQSMLGLTLGCARCHDHKFDPVNAADYYAWYGIFDSTKYSFPGSEEKKRPYDLFPDLPAEMAASLKAKQDQQLAELDQRIKELEQPLSEAESALLASSERGFELEQLGQTPGKPWETWGTVTVTESAQSPFVNAYLPGSQGLTFPGNDANNAFGLRLETAHTAETSPQLHYNIDFRNVAVSKGATGSYRFYVGHGPGNSSAVEMGATATEFIIRNGSDYEVVRPLTVGQWYNVQLTLDLKTRTYSGTIGFPGDVTTFSGKDFSSGWDGTIDYTFVDKYGHLPGVAPARELDNVAVSTTPLLPVDQTVATLQFDAEMLANLIARREQLASLKAQQLTLQQSLPYEQIFGAAEAETPHDVPIQLRGELTKPGDVIPRRNLEILGHDPLPEGAGSGRLKLAEWITRPENPLTARVMANRIWQKHFGRGLVGTENDFGARGEHPSHPELLDWLASRFMESGWSLKTMHRLIMNSAAYQQGSETDPHAAELDPDARLLWRFNPRRLSAEEIRDSMLAVCGELDRSQSGPHPFPPVETWGFSQHGPFYAVYPTKHRSVYLMQQRLKKHPFLGLFDGADTNTSTARRDLTTVPTQALYLMNNDFVQDCSQAFADQVVKSASSEQERIQQAFQISLCREATPEEQSEAATFLTRYRALLPAESPAQQELAAWSALARTLLTRNEFLYVD